MFRSTKRFGPISTCHRNWQAAHNLNRDSRKCSLIHGYSRHVQLTFEGELDEQAWVFDFGDCKFIKQFLDEEWDHKVLVSNDDPEIDSLKEMEAKNLLKLTIIANQPGWNPGMEGSCKYLYDKLQPVITEKTKGRVNIVKVEVWEHENNSAIYIP